MRAVVGTVILPEDLAAKRYARTLPGVVGALGFWDPLGFTDGQVRAFPLCLMLFFL